VSAGCPAHPEFDRGCADYRCTRNWSPPGAPDPAEQLAKWVLGESVCPNARHECCPDFSCCKPELKWPEEKRRRFAAAGQGEREKMMMGALGSAMAQASAKKVYVTRGDPADRE
jgi:hypothetical protein